MYRRFAPVIAIAFLLGCQQEREDGEAAAAPEVSAPQVTPAGTPGPQGMGMRRGPGPHGAGAPCPMMVQGATVTAEDTDAGAALVFTTTGDVDALRQQVRAMAERHNAMGQADGRMHPMPMAGVPATVEDVEGGARLVFTPATEAQKAQVSEHVHTMAQSMSSTGTCPAMGAGGAATPQ